MIAVEVREDHRIDCTPVDAGGGEIGVELADRTLGCLELGRSVAGIDHDQLAAGIHDDWRERRRHLVLFSVAGDD